MKIYVSRHRAPVPYLPENLKGLRVAQISDLHRSAETPDALIQHAVEAVMHECPDLILLTGDFVSENPADIAPCMKLLAPLKAPLGLYATLGNHDYRAGPKKVREALEKNGIEVLTNRSLRLENGLTLVGLDDHKVGRPDVEKAFACVGERDPLLVLSHNPVGAEDLRDRPCLIFSGHTHGGQINIPLLSHWAVRHAGGKHYRSGWFTVGRARVYVNQGIGMVGMAVRFLCPSEAAIFTLEPASG